MRVLALASYDSFVNIAHLLALHFERRGCAVDFALVRTRANEQAQISNEQISRFGLDGKLRWVWVEELCTSGELAGFDIVLCCLEGASTRRLVHHVCALGAKRPLLISVYPGLLLRDRFDGFSMRTGSDLVWLNCEADREAFAQMCSAFGVDPSGARVFGMSSMLRPVTRIAGAGAGPVVFFEQAIIPRHQDERLFLAEQLLKLAKANPSYEFLVKARTAGNDATLHRTGYPIDRLLEQGAAKFGGWPANLTLTTDTATELLSKASHCLTVSSTVAAEAIGADIPTAIIGDFGAREEYGLHYFFRSGLIRRFAELRFPFEGKPLPEWQAAYMADPRQAVDRLVGEALELAGKPRQPMAERSADAELSPDLRKFLIELNGARNLLSRGYQKPKKHQTIFKRIISGLKRRLDFRP